MNPTAWQKRLSARYQKTLMQLTASQDKELNRIVSTASRRASVEMSKVAGNGVGAVVRRSQYLAAKASINQITDEMWASVDNEITKNLSTASQLAVNENRELLSILTKAVGPGRAGILADSLQASAASTFGNLRSRLLNDIDLSPNVFNNSALMSGKIDAVVNNGILLGQSSREIAANVKQYINPRVMGGPRYAAQRLGRTEINNAYHTTTRNAYAQSPYVLGVQWSLSGSHPRADACDSYAHEDTDHLGEGIFRPDNVPDKPHPQCFCFITAVTPEPDEFFRDMTKGEFACGRV